MAIELIDISKAPIEDSFTLLTTHLAFIDAITHTKRLQPANLTQLVEAAMSLSETRILEYAESCEANQGLMTASDILTHLYQDRLQSKNMVEAFSSQDVLDKTDHESFKSLFITDLASAKLSRHFSGETFFNDKPHYEAYLQHKIGERLTESLMHRLHDIEEASLVRILDSTEHAPSTLLSQGEVLNNLINCTKDRQGIYLINWGVSVCHVANKYYALNPESMVLCISDNTDELLDYFDDIHPHELFNPPCYGVMYIDAIMPKLQNHVEPTDKSDPETSLLSMQIISGFIVALGATAVALAVTLLPLVPGILVSAIGAATVIGGLSLFAQASEQDEEEVQANLIHGCPG